MGRYLCLTKGNWEAGLPLLALSGDAKLKELAKKELAKPGVTMAQVELADAWSELAEAEKEPGKTNLQRRALHWFRQALPGLTGLTKTRVEKTVQELAKLSEPEKTITNSIGMKLAYIPSGEFTMGSPDKEANRQPIEGPQHKVKITKAFYLGVYEVKQSEYEKVVGKNPSAFKDSPDHPVESVIWDEAVEFCKKLSELPEEKTAGRVYRLPTEAEWEYACRAGTKTVFHYGDSLSSKQANFNGDQPYGSAEKGVRIGKSTQCGSYAPNRWGLFDMHGNVCEWCLDAARPYTANAVEDPRGSEAAGGSRVLRGGGWRGVAWPCRCAMRSPYPLSSRINDVGFRVVLVR
jgi:formylglycine-generating enzyme required for sulfatase activity